MSSVDFSVNISPPNIVIEMEMVGGVSAVFEYDLEDVLEIDGGDLSVLESTESGLVLENENGETEFLDLRGEIKFLDLRNLND